MVETIGGGNHYCWAGLFTDSFNGHSQSKLRKRKGLCSDQKALPVPAYNVKETTSLFEREEYPITSN